MLPNLSINQKLSLQFAAAAVVAALIVTAGSMVKADLSRAWQQQYEMLASQQLKLLADVGDITPELQHRLTATTEAAAKNGLEILDAAASTLLLVLVAAGAVTFVVIFLTSRSIYRPLKWLLDALDGIGRSHDMNARIPVSGDNEIARVANGFNAHSERLQTIIRDVGHYTARMEAELQQLSEVIAESADHIDTQQHEIGRVAGAMHEMAASVHQVSDNAAQAADAAQEADAGAKEGRELVLRNLECSRQLARTVEKTKVVMSRLEEGSGNIGVVLEVIREIADQTNLLALNAAIEAARAGDQGRGFAVVADEVRVLAQRTQDSTREIQQTIEELQAGAGEAARAMAESQQQMDETVELADRAGSAIETIAGAVGRIREMNAQIAVAAEQQSEVAEGISKNLNTVNVASEKTADSARQTAEFGKELVRLAEAQRTVVAQFETESSKGFDFEAAKEAHLAWKKRLADFLDGKAVLTQKQAVSHHDCVLGKWYYGDGSRKYGGIPEMQAIEQPHAELHGIIRDIVELKQRGEIGKAEEEFRRVEPLSNKIVSMLDDLELKVAS